MIIQVQKWYGHLRYLIIHSYGSVMLDLFPEAQEFGGTAYIWGLYVGERDRRKGIATILLDEAEHIAKTNNHDAVFMAWELKNTPVEVLKWYQRRGYDEVESGSDNCLLKKKL